MKKIITLCIFAFTMLIGTASVRAQNKIEVNAQASKKTELLNAYIKYNSSDQKEDIYQAFKEYYTIQASLKKSSQVDTASIKKANTVLENKLKDILTEEQFQTYTDLAKGNK